MSLVVLDELERAGHVPVFVVTTPDKPQGRKLILTPTEVKTWAEKKNIPVFAAEKLNEEFTVILQKEIAKTKLDFCLVASFGKIIPEKIIEAFGNRMINIHPSLLPRYRGPSPLQSAILADEKNTGVSLLLIDREMDHGPIIAQENVTLTEWPTYEVYEEDMARRGARLLVAQFGNFAEGRYDSHVQDHSVATFTKKFRKEDGLINLGDDPYQNFRKIQAFHEWPQAFFSAKHNGRDIRVKITEASYSEGVLTIDKVIPEGSKEMPYSDFLKGYAMERSGK